MMKMIYSLTGSITAVFLSAAIATGSAQTAALPGGHPSLEVAAAPAPVWNPPTNWIASPATAMVIKNFSITGSAGQSAKVAISAFPGEVGGILANVNRWRGQIGLPPIDDSALGAAAQKITVAGGNATLVDLTNPDGAHSRLVAAIVSHGSDTWFYKLTGENNLVGQEKAPFVKFVQSVVYPQP